MRTLRKCAQSAKICALAKIRKTSKYLHPYENLHNFHRFTRDGDLTLHRTGCVPASLGITSLIIAKKCRILAG
jgi:hypothetical protein